jgi:hypothetical protein
MVGVELPADHEGKFPRILAGANPGNVGHQWVKTTFIDGTDTYQVRQMPPEQGGMKRQFIPALLEDNPSMAAHDPGYEARLQGLGSEALVAAMRYGNWDVVDGAFFDCWDPNRHIIQPFQVPRHWMRFCSMDWGSASPFSVGWWAVVPDRYEAQNRNGGTVVMPRGYLLRVKEWYGAKKPNEGLKLHAEEVGRGVLERDVGEQISYRVLDPAAFSEDGGPSIEERMRKATSSKVVFRRADNARVSGRGAMGGWDQVRARMVGDADGHPMIGCFSTCHDSIRTIPALQHDSNRPEDLDTHMEDHAADEWRYACMSRPWVKPTASATRPKAADYNRFTPAGSGGSWRTA